MKKILLSLLLCISTGLWGEDHPTQPATDTPAAPTETKDEKKEDKEEQEEQEKEQTSGKGGNEEEDKETAHPEFYPDTKFTGGWYGRRDLLRDRGIEFTAQLFLLDTWNVDGGLRTTPYYGAFQETFLASVAIKSCPLFRYEGGLFFAKYISHHGKVPFREFVGSFIPVYYYEADPFDALYELWYKQEFGDNFWLLFGKTDAYDNFCNVPPLIYFFNAGYTTMPSIDFFPSYPESAMSVIGSIHSGDLIFLAGVFDGSFAEGFHTGRSLTGHFFDHLNRHAFLIAEVDWSWKWCKRYPGVLQLGVWKHTANFTKFNGRRKNGTEGVYFTYQQVLSLRKWGCFTKTLTFFTVFGATSPSVSAVHYNSGIGLTWKGFNLYRPNDVMGIAMSRVDFTDAPEAGFTKSFEASYEVFYYWRLRPGVFLQPDFQYIVHPGGKGLPNASVFFLQLQVDF